MHSFGQEFIKFWTHVSFNFFQPSSSSPIIIKVPTSPQSLILSCSQAVQYSPDIQLYFREQIPHSNLWSRDSRMNINHSIAFIWSPLSSSPVPDRSQNESPVAAILHTSQYSLLTRLGLINDSHTTLISIQAVIFSQFTSSYETQLHHTFIHYSYAPFLLPLVPTSTIYSRSCRVFL